MADGSEPTVEAVAPEELLSLQTVAAQVDAARARLELAETRHTMMFMSLGHRYALREGDQIELATGRILRRAKSA